ncbi:hypothetical protein BU17DRAFT_72339 [Hysterangium stoloniferum]|nr:hypothetical protein BU17DRAFT_72339 [Hysterangium stoloniferum]
MPKNTTSPHDFRPKTPPSGPTADPTKLGATPILKKESRSQVYTSMHIGRDERITAMSKEISGRVVGPVRAEDFLSQYLPKTRNPCPEFTADTLKAFSQSKNEYAMYKPWINLLAKFCPNLELVDAHTTPAVDFGGKQVKPDIQIYSRNSKRSGLSDMTQTEMVVEFKLDKEDDAFNDNGPFEHSSSKTARDTLGQITLYATAHQAAQFRTHVFLVLVFPKYARFTRWDRSGVVVTEKVPFSNPFYVEFFWRFNHASPAARGVDTTATEFPHNHPVAITAKRSLGLEDGDRLFQVKLDPKGDTYLFYCPTYMAVGSPLGRSTRVFTAYCVETGKLVLLKDTWRVVSPSQSSEHTIYEGLKKHRVRNICTCKEGSDVLDQVTKTQDASMGRRLSSPLRRLQHYRLVLNEIGRSLTDFRNTKEMVTAVRDAIIAHGDAYDKAEILHRDISSGNILITQTGGGLLIDWDLCKKLQHIRQGQGHIERTGTWQFMAARLLVIPTDGELPVIPDRADDLESFFYVIVWIALRCTEHSFVQAFDDHYLDPQGAAKGGDRKKVEVCFSDPFQVSRLFNVSLRELIKTLAKTFAVRYEEAPKATEIAQYKQLFEKEGTSGAKSLHLSGLADDDAVLSTLLAGKYLKRVTALGRSDWMASELTTALQKSGWHEHGGPVQRDLSTPPPSQPMVPKTECSEDPFH